MHLWFSCMAILVMIIGTIDLQYNYSCISGIYTGIKMSLFTEIIFHLKLSYALPRYL